MNVSFTWVGGATWFLDVEGVRIACDPVLCAAGTVQNYGFFRSRRLNEPQYTPPDFEHIDLWLITHAHDDHLDAGGLQAIASNARIITHANAVKKLRNSGHTNFTILEWGDQRTLVFKEISVTIETIPAVHGPNPLVAMFAGGVNGYWLKIQAQKMHFNAYITGDTVAHPRIFRAIQGRQADLLIPNLGAAKQDSWMGPLTLSAAMLRRFLEALQPKVCVPVHFGTFEHYAEPISMVKSWSMPNIFILQPGQTMEPLTN
jgi:L-ascorbate metabolism protein UlaG (beta-lactamase superfamily)